MSSHLQQPVGSRGPAIGAVARLMFVAISRGSRFAMLLGLVAGTVGVAAFVAFERTGAAAMQALERSAAEGALPSVIVTRASGLSAREVEAALVLDGGEGDVRAVLARQFSVVRADHAGRSEPLLLIGVELAKEAMARPGRMRGVGRAREDLIAGGILLDRASASALGVGLGSALSLRYGDAVSDVTVAAILDELGPDTVVRGVAIAELETSRRILGRTNVDESEVMLAPDREPGRCAEVMQERLGPGYRVSPRLSRRPAAASITAMRTTWHLASWLVLAVGALALLAALRDQVRARSADTELLFALGAERWLVRCHRAIPAALVALVATLAGAMLGGELADGMTPGLAAWVRVQTGVGILIEQSAATWQSWLGLALGAVLFGGLAALWSPRAGSAAGAARAFAPSRFSSAAAALLAMAAITFTGLLSQHAVFRVLDLVLGVLVAVWLAPPVAGLLARFLFVVTRGGALATLARARFTREPGGLLLVLRLGAVSGAVIVALTCVATSLRLAAPDIIRAAVPTDSVTLSLGEALGIEGAGLAASQAAPVGAAVDAPVPVIPGALVVSGSAWRSRLLAIADRAIDTVDAMTSVLAFLAAIGVVVLLWLDLRRRADAEGLLVALGSSRGQRLLIRATTGAIAGLAVALTAAIAGVPIGLVWTRGALHQALGWDCEFVVPAGLLLVATALPFATALVSAAVVVRSWSR